jgi:predicted DCC family thiol-disulfide oxidoreductase YuxK
MNLPENKKIVLFDGVCNLCDATVQELIRKDKKDVFRL